MALAAAGVQMVGQAISANTQAKNIDSQTKVLKDQAQLDREAAVSVLQTGVLNNDKMTRAGRETIASSENAMLAGGNIGTSQQESLFNAYFKLDRDVAAQRYDYREQAKALFNKANQEERNAKIMKSQKSDLYLASLLNGATTAANGAMNYYKLGGEF